MNSNSFMAGLWADGNPTDIHMDALMNTRRLLIVDDVAQVRTDLCTLLPLAADIVVVGEAANGLEAVHQVDVLQPDVVLMDLEMPVMNGYEATRQIKGQSPACRVIALTVHGYTEAIDRALQSGADAFVVKGAPLANLIREILKEE
jgi:DNA-binding NarL/FixJ family response regulator